MPTTTDYWLWPARAIYERARRETKTNDVFAEALNQDFEPVYEQELPEEEPTDETD